jgi:hypothetical protein
LALLLFPALALGCGVTFREQFFGTELFQSIDLSGQREINSELTLSLTITQGYPVPVHIACYYEDGSKLTDDQHKLAFQERATLIGETVLPGDIRERPGGSEVKAQKLSYKFRLAEPGDYFLACLTPASPENGLGYLFTIKPPPGSTATPVPTPRR